MVTKGSSRLAAGDPVQFEWSLGTRTGRIREIYGPPARRFAVIELDDEPPDEDGPITVSLPLDLLEHR